MSVYGGDSWGREAQHRKRKVDDLMLPTSPSSGNPSSYRKLSNGKYACLVCPHRPILDTTLMLSMHNKGSRHIAAKSRLKGREISMQEEINKRKALSACSTVSGTSNDGLKQSRVQDKPLIEHTRRAILKIQCKRSNDLAVRLDRPSTTVSSCYSELHSNMSDIKTPHIVMVDQLNCCSRSEITTEAVDGTLANRNAELRKRQEKELKFTAAGWKRDGYGKWYKDENVEFDSDEEDPNICLE